MCGRYVSPDDLLRDCRLETLHFLNPGQVAFEATRNSLEYWHFVAF